MSGTDLKKFDAQLEKLDRTGGSALRQILTWSAHVGIPAAFAIIMLLQTNTKLDRLVECIVKLTVVVESKK